MRHRIAALLIGVGLSLPLGAFASDDKPAGNKPAADKPTADKPASDKPAAAPAGACAAHTATIYGAKARCWRTQKHLERATKLGMTIEYHDVDADPAAMKYTMANKDHLAKDKNGEIELPLLLIDGKFATPEVKTLDAACAAKN